MRWENPNDFGSTFWPAPQSEWNWPPIATYDSKPYTAVVQGNSVKLTATGRATGSANITVTTEDGNKTCVLYVTETKPAEAPKEELVTFN